MHGNGKRKKVDMICAHCKKRKVWFNSNVFSQFEIVK